jgi:hypothetical protein
MNVALIPPVLVDDGKNGWSGWAFLGGELALLIKPFANGELVAFAK